MLAPLTAACISAAAAAYSIAPPALWTILKTEGGKVGICTTQVNGMHDCGPAQVNIEIWAPNLAQLLNRSVAEIQSALRDNGCFNIHAAAYILRVKTDETNGDSWEGMERYNNSKPAIKSAYQSKLLKAFEQLYPDEQMGSPSGAKPVASTPSAVKSSEATDRRRYRSCGTRSTDG
jgi:hypothetical protein